ncbi:M48 family metalloprotease [Jatrophihabitans sp.]|uniref:M48 family metalloprotease n=1 Tax=Jatrophihabitans sp. TaxID=1932789 RepID=UPI0030C6E0AB|nr:peptidase Ste24p [Jatrophihabitans sp.]
MQTLVYLPIALSVVFGLIVGPVALRLPPQAATWLISVGGLIAAVGSTSSLSLLAFTLVGQNPVLAAQGRWSQSALHHDSPVPAAVAGIALIALAVISVRLLRSLIVRASAMRDAHLLSRSLATGDQELAVLDEAAAQAYAVPGWPGRIVVTSGLLRRLDAGERRAMLAHERSHLAHHHHLHQTAVRLAAAANPSLRQLPALAAWSCERWADEDAALTSPRGTVASALTRAAGADLFASPGVVLAAGAIEVDHRVRALGIPAPRLRRWPLVSVTLVLLVIVAAVGVAMHDTERLFEIAQRAYLATH